MKTDAEVADAVVAAVASAAGLDPAALAGRRRDRVAVRTAAALALMAEGWPMIRAATLCRISRVALRQPSDGLSAQVRAYMQAATTAAVSLVAEVRNAATREDMARRRDLEDLATQIVYARAAEQGVAPRLVRDMSYRPPVARARRRLTAARCLVAVDLARAGASTQDIAAVMRTDPSTASRWLHAGDRRGPPQTTEQRATMQVAC